jgi:hypothetical protein
MRRDGEAEGPVLIDSLKKTSAKRDFADRLVKGDAGIHKMHAMHKMHGTHGMHKMHKGPAAVTIAFPDVCKTPGPSFAAGTFNPSSAHGRELLAHELAHAVQQTPRRR